MLFTLVRQIFFTVAITLSEHICAVTDEVMLVLLDLTSIHFFTAFEYLSCTLHLGLGLLKISVAIASRILREGILGLI